jgi:nucleotide-binding universal stress UspA family protein
MTTKPAALVVVGVDGSAESLRAVDWTAEEARLRHRPLRIVHAFLWPLMRVPLGPSPLGPPDGGLRHAAEQILATAADRAREAAAALEVSTDLPVCAPAPALIDASRDAALVVVGNVASAGLPGCSSARSASRSPPTRPARSSSYAATTNTPVPVRRPARWLVGVDGSEMSNLAVGFAFEQASRRGLGVVAVHAYHWPQPTEPGDMLPLVYDVDELRGEEARLLAEALSGWSEK